MIKLDPLAIYVGDHRRSRDWYTQHFGFRVEFEVPERDTVALQDDAGLTMFLGKDLGRARHPSRARAREASFPAVARKPR